ncbi:MAG: hypothetical protein CSB55_05355 [Candidatus Cloacimonadota bacterium]|nr:MAG: hypothetical protein CSB55_05355 [Candidatus Cloacimonadota bacterium]
MRIFIHIISAFGAIAVFLIPGMNLSLFLWNILPFATASGLTEIINRSRDSSSQKIPFSLKMCNICGVTGFNFLQSFFITAWITDFSRIKTGASTASLAFIFIPAYSLTAGIIGSLIGFAIGIIIEKNTYKREKIVKNTGSRNEKEQKISRQAISNKNFTDEISIRGGARTGLFNVTFPFAKLIISQNKLELNIFILGKFIFSSKDVISIEPYVLIPFLGQGIKINHSVKSYDSEIIFWTFNNPQELIEKINETGFSDKFYKPLDGQQKKSPKIGDWK